MSSSSSAAAAPAPNGGATATAGDESALILSLPAPQLHHHPPSSAPSASRRLPPPCWSHNETLALIDSYTDKWYALRRGNLRASHWQEVADAVNRCCCDRLLPAAATPKTSVQCRHKVEKLRKRYRADRKRSIALDPSAPPSSPWVFFTRMDAMELGGRGPTPPSSSRLAAARTRSPPSSSSSDPDSSDDRGNIRSLHGLMANGGTSRSGGGGIRFTIPKAMRSKIQNPRIDRPGPGPGPNPNPRFLKGHEFRSAAEDTRRRTLEKNRKKQRGRGRDGDAAGEMVSALRMLGDGYMRMEQMKMDMARQTEKVRMEMELKRTQMILESQRQIVDAFVSGFVGGGGRKISPES